MHSDLQDLLAAGVGGSTLVFGEDGTPVPASRIADAGCRLFGARAPDPCIAALLTNDRPSVEVVLGAILSGARLVSLPIPPRAADVAGYVAFVEQACAWHGATRIVARDDIAGVLSAMGFEAIPHSFLGHNIVAEPTATGFELIQFTSGSTGSPRGIMLDGVTLGRNVTAILERVAPRPGDATVSWLPLSHDMGLIGMLVSSIVATSPPRARNASIVLLEPERFLRSPVSWVRAMDRWKATFTAAPDFGFRLAAQRRPRDRVDLRQLRCAIVGGEIIRAATLHTMAETFRDDGLDEVALSPAYGMAEIGLAASLTPPVEHWSEERLDLASFVDNLRRGADRADESVVLVGSGRPLDGYRIEVTAPSDGVGPIRIQAPGVGLDAATGRSLTGDDGFLHTGDVGYVSDDGSVYVCGRDDDRFVARGRNIYAPSVEFVVSNLPDVRAGRVTAISTPTGDWLIAVEVSADPLSVADIRRVERDVRRAAVSVTSAQPDAVVLVRPGALPMTSSGKLQRHEVRRRWLTGTLETL